MIYLWLLLKIMGMGELSRGQLKPKPCSWRRGELQHPLWLTAPRLLQLLMAPVPVTESSGGAHCPQRLTATGPLCSQWLRSLRPVAQRCGTPLPAVADGSGAPAPAVAQSPRQLTTLAPPLRTQGWSWRENVTEVSKSHRIYDFHNKILSLVINHLDFT